MLRLIWFPVVVTWLFMGGAEHAEWALIISTIGNRRPGDGDLGDELGDEATRYRPNAAYRKVLLILPWIAASIREAVLPGTHYSWVGWSNFEGSFLLK